MKSPSQTGCDSGSEMEGVSRSETGSISCSETESVSGPRPQVPRRPISHSETTGAISHSETASKKDSSILSSEICGLEGNRVNWDWGLGVCTNLCPEVNCNREDSHEGFRRAAARG